MDYRKDGLSGHPTTAREAFRRTSAQKLSDKIFSVLHRSESWCRFDTSDQGVPGLVREIFVNLAVAAKEGTLSDVPRRMFEKMSRAEIMCLIFWEVRYAFRINQDKYGNNPNGEQRMFIDGGQTNGHSNMLLIRQLTCDEITRKYCPGYVNSWREEHPEFGFWNILYRQFLGRHGIPTQGERSQRANNQVLRLLRLEQSV